MESEIQFIEKTMTMTMNKEDKKCILNLLRRHSELITALSIMHPMSSEVPKTLFELRESELFIETEKKSPRNQRKIELENSDNSCKAVKNKSIDHIYTNFKSFDSKNKNFHENLTHQTNFRNYPISFSFHSSGQVHPANFFSRGNSLTFSRLIMDLHQFHTEKFQFERNNSNFMKYSKDQSQVFIDTSSKVRILSQNFEHFGKRKRLEFDSFSNSYILGLCLPTEESAKELETVKMKSWHSIMHYHYFKGQFECDESKVEKIGAISHRR